jgi:3-hydroxyacyl-[acyl-carrier-protein] dehydratase
MRELFSITACPEEGRSEVLLNPDHAIFRGHFPDKPVLPGVCSMMIVRECASLIAGRPLRYASVRECKFLAAITPDASLSVEVRLTPEEDDYRLDATIESGETTMLKIKARLTADE